MEGGRLLLHPLPLHHGHPPPSCALSGGLPQVTHPGHQAGRVTPHEHHTQNSPVLAQDEARLTVRERPARLPGQVQGPRVGQCPDQPVQVSTYVPESADAETKEVLQATTPGQLLEPGLQRSDLAVVP